MMFWIITFAWLAACVLAIRWSLPRIEAAQRELEHDDALRRDAEWDRRINPVGKSPVKRPVGPPNRIVKEGEQPVPPILNQSEKWQERARKAEGLGFLDVWDTDPKDAA